MKHRADIRNKAKSTDIQVGDNVLIRNKVRENKLTTTFNSNPQTVTKKKGTMVTVSDNIRDTTRNTSFFKKTSHRATSGESEEDVMENEIGKKPSDKKSKDNSAEIHLDRPKREYKKPKYLKDFVCS